VSEFEDPERFEREPTVEDIRELMGASTPHFALQIRNRIQNLIEPLPEGHPARLVGEREVARLDRIAFEGERRGPEIEGERELPSIRRPSGEIEGEPPADATKGECGLQSRPAGAS
jgi:hypothetical protein